MAQSKNSSRQKNQPEKPDPIMSLLRSCIDEQVSPAMPCEPVWKAQKTKSGRTEYQLLHLGRSATETSDELWPTPSASSATIQDMEQAKFAGNDPNRPKYSEVKKTGSLNPSWVECLMNYPLGWTDLDCDEPEPWPGWPALMGKRLWRTPQSQEPGIKVEHLEGEPGHRLYDKDTGRLAQYGVSQQVELVKENQYPYEPPRTVTGCPDRAKRLKALGNSVVPRQALGIFLCIRTIFDVLDSNGQNDRIKIPREPGGVSYDVSENAAEAKKTA